MTKVYPRFISGCACYQYNENWWRYRIDNLIALNTSPTASGSYGQQLNGATLTVFPNSKRATFSNGDEPGHYARMRFNSDFKEINPTARTIKSFKPDNMATPYKTETFDNIPAAPKLTTYDPSVWYAYIAYLPNYYDDIFGVSTETKDSIDGGDIGYWAPAGDPKGNYYTIARLLINQNM